MNELFLGPPAKPGTTAAAIGPAADVDCPDLDIRQGASTYAVAATGSEASATNLRYQAIIARASRECAVLGATMTIKLGVQGRVLLGPAGGPGRLDVPLRVALVQEGIQPKTIWTKLYRVPVTIPPEQTSVTFVQIEEDMTFPLPSRADLAAYVIYIGYDSGGAKDDGDRKKPSGPRRKNRASG